MNMLTSPRSFLIHTECRSQAVGLFCCDSNISQFKHYGVWYMHLVLFFESMVFTEPFCLQQKVHIQMWRKPFLPDNYELKIWYWQDTISLSILDCCIKVLGENFISYSSYLLPSLYWTRWFQFPHCHWRHVTVTKSTVIMINLVFWNLPTSL